VTTDSNGEFIMANLPQGAYTVTASATGYTTAAQGVEVVAGEISQVDFALTKLTSPSLQPFWVQSITFGVRGKNLLLSITVVDASGVVAGAQVTAQLTNNVQDWNLTGTTDSSGTASFIVTKAPASSYMVSVTAITLAGYTWDTTQGLTSASYIVKSGGRKK
jgi:hypothetical protein